MLGPVFAPSPVVCATCLAEGRAQRTEYSLGLNLYVCPLHGRHITAELVHDLASS